MGYNMSNSVTSSPSIGGNFRESASGSDNESTFSSDKVSGLGSRVSVNLSQVESLGFSTAARAGQLVRAELRATSRPQIKASLKQRDIRPGSQAVVFNDLGSSHRQFSVGRAKQIEIDAAYRELRNLVAPSAQKVNFNLSKMTVWIRDENGVEHINDLQEIVERNADYMEKFLILDDLVSPVWGAPLRGQSIESGKKSTSNSLRPMQRNNEALMALPGNEHSDSEKKALELYARKEKDQAKRSAASQRITAIEGIVDPLVNKVKEKLKIEQTALASAAPSLQPAITVKIKELETLLGKLQVDRLGLYVAAAFSPTPVSNPQDALIYAQIAAKDAQEVLQGEIDATRDRLMRDDIRRNWPKWLPKFVRGKAEPIPENKAYSVDAAALVFSSLPIASARHGALDFWKQHQLFQKMDCLEDELIRFAVAGDRNIPWIEKTIEGIGNQEFKAELRAVYDEVMAKAQEILNGRTSVSASSSAAAIPPAMEDNGAGVETGL